jgi:hypothetical protein
MIDLNACRERADSVSSYVAERRKVFHALLTVTIAMCGVVGFSALESASATAAGDPQWTVTSISQPTNFAQGDVEDAYRIAVTNTGDAPSDGSPVVITDEIPLGLGLSAAEVSGIDELVAVTKGAPGAKFSCAFRTCIYTGVVVPDDTLIVTVPVDVLGSLSSVTNIARVSGGGAPDAFMRTPTEIYDTRAEARERTGFGVSPGSAITALSNTQAGAHPDITTSIAFDTVNRAGSLAGNPKDIVTDEPSGFAGDLVDTPSCSAAVFSRSACPIGAQVGITTVSIHDANGVTTLESQPVYNLAPNPGEAAKFGFNIVHNFAIQGNVSVRQGDYGLRVAFHDTDESIVEVDNVSLTVWGVPADPVHDPWRWKPEAASTESHFGTSSEVAPAAYFTNPTSCTEPLEAKMALTSWEGREVQIGMPFGPIVGCDRLSLPASFTAEPTTDHAYAPTGLNVNLNVHQTYDNAYGLASSTLKKAVVTLPEGITVNPSAGAGLGACTLAEFEEEALDVVTGRGCPNDSKLGSVRIKTPALAEEGTGSVFIAQPAPLGEAGKNPFNSLLALYVVARFADRGVLVKVAGKVTADETTGRLVTTFERQPSLGGLPGLEGLPPVPFSTFTFKFNQGQTSPLVTPPTCGNDYSVFAALNPWSEPATLLTLFAPPFSIAHGFDGGPCPSGGVPPFAPQAFAGTQINKAGSYSQMYIRVVRGDGEQEVTRFSSQLPSGLTANLSGVPFCSEADIANAKARSGAQEEAEPSCPSSSEVGHTLVGAGVGSVLAWAPGKVYMAGPYNGAPFSIVAVTSAKVGPFDLGTVVVREALRIDPNTAIVTADASASDPIPHIIKGIVVHVRDIRVYLDRSNFALNPTSCAPMTFSVTVNGSGANFTTPTDDVPVTVRDPFQAADCQSLKFKPVFRVSTSGRTSRTRGASLHVKLTYPKAPLGTQTNIRSVKVDLPRQLPSRLTTLQKACPDSTFNANPAGCPMGSRVGYATALTPILPVPLTGPAYFVSHGSAKFPELIIVLQGYGVTINLHGDTFINKRGITSSTFHAVPDQPVTSFDLTLPQGPNSALAANGKLCQSKLRMPTAFTGQNGLVIHRSTKISVTGCPKARKVSHHKRGHGKGRHDGRRSH